MPTPPKKHSIVKRVTKRSGFRVEYTILLNEKELAGKVIQTRSKGKEVWKTQWNGVQIPYYDPQWLAHRNGRTIRLPHDHPEMRQANAFKQAMAALEQVQQLQEAA